METIIINIVVYVSGIQSFTSTTYMGFRLYNIFWVTMAVYLQ